MVDIWLSRLGQSQRYVLSDERLAIDAKVIELPSIARVRLATLGEMQVCEVVQRDGTTATIVNDAKDNRASYAELVRAFHARLSERAPEVLYVRGAWLLVGVNLAIGVLVLAAAFAIRQGWFSVPPALAGKATLIMVLGVVWLVVGPLLVWRSRPRSYDPRAVPDELLR